MQVAKTGSAPKPALLEEKELKFTAFASDIEIKLTVAIVQNLICIPTKAGQKCSAQDAVKFMMLCQARRLNPFEGDCFLQGYDGRNGPVFSLITAHQAFLKRAEVNDQYDGMESGVIVSDEKGNVAELHGDFYVKSQQTLIGGWAKVYCKNRKYPMYKRLDVTVFNKGFGRWEDDPAGMIVKCAEADALRSAFPTMLGNLYLEQELNLEKNVTPASTPPNILSIPTGGTTEPVQPQNTPPAETKPVVLEPKPAKVETSEPEPGTPTEDKTASLDANGVISMLKTLLTRDNVSEDQLLAHCKETKLANKHTEVWQLADSKLRTLVNEWDARKADIASITI